MVLPTQSKNGITFYEKLPTAPKDNVTYLLLHGLGNSLNFWVEVAPALGEVRRTIAIDIPGFGRSPVPSNGFTLENISQAIKDFSETLRLSECVLVAHSLGCFIGLRLAGLEPQRFRRLILVDGTLNRTVGLLQHPRNVLSHPLLGCYLSAQFIGGLLPIRKRAANIISHSRIIRDLTLWPFVADPNNLNPRILTTALSDNGGATVLKVLTEAHSINYSDLTSAVSQPVDLVWGAEDRLISDQDVEYARQQMHVDREMKIAACGHWPMIERPSDLTRFLLLEDVDH